MTMGYQVFIPEDIAKIGKDYLLERGYEIKMGMGIDEATVIAEGKDADALILRLAPNVTRKVLESWPKMKVVARHGVGYDNVDIHAAEEMGIWVTNAPLSNANTVAEATITLILTIAKNIIRVNQEMYKGDFAYKNKHKGMDIGGKKLGILGFGRIGRLVAKKAEALDMQVLVFNRRVIPAVAQEFPNVTIVTDRDEIFKEADFITLHLSSNEQTKHSIGEREFGLMKESAYLINLARGEIVDEPALIKALQNKEIRGAALDVFSQEPLPLDSPLFQLENVVLTPHIASNTVECMETMALHSAMEVHKVLSGEKPSWPVNSPDKQKA